MKGIIGLILSSILTGPQKDKKDDGLFWLPLEPNVVSYTVTLISGSLSAIDVMEGNKKVRKVPLTLKIKHSPPGENKAFLSPISGTILVIDSLRGQTLQNSMGKNLPPS